VTGAPQGGVVSPLLANIYLHRLDLHGRATGTGSWSVSPTTPW
jgi:retron-type reverse transcriptase